MIGIRLVIQVEVQLVEKMDANLAEYNQIHPDQITCDVINGFLNGKPLSRNDGGKDFVDFVMQHLQSEYARNKIKYSRLKNGE